jgi:NTP pyrophosphatase (non-canonical NTP hydrolase)
MQKCDSNTTLEEVKGTVAKFCDERGWAPFHGAKDLSIGLVTEASDLLEIFRFVPEAKLGSHMENPEIRAHVADELADSLYFILRFAELYNFDLSECLKQKMVKNAVKYPPPAARS